jgi:gas vesicle protein
MEYDHEGQVFNFLTGLVLGAFIGAGAALLTAPQSGRRTRRKIKRAASGVRENAGDRWEDLADDVKDRVDEAVHTARNRFQG